MGIADFSAGASLEIRGHPLLLYGTAESKPDHHNGSSRRHVLFTEPLLLTGILEGSRETTRVLSGTPSLALRPQNVQSKDSQRLAQSDTIK